MGGGGHLPSSRRGRWRWREARAAPAKLCSLFQLLVESGFGTRAVLPWRRTTLIYSAIRTNQKIKAIPLSPAPTPPQASGPPLVKCLRRGPLGSSAWILFALSRKSKRNPFRRRREGHVRAGRTPASPRLPSSGAPPLFLQHYHSPWDSSPSNSLDDPSFPLVRT